MTYIREIFDYIAVDYDRMNRLMSWGLDHYWRSALIRQAGLREGDKALDVCTGTGETAFLLGEKVGATGSVTGLDFSARMLEIAREKLSRQKDQRPISFIPGDALSLPFDDETFDCVTSAFALRNLDDLGLGLKEMVRVCKKGGHVVCLDISEPRGELFKRCFHLYFGGLIPLAGRLIGKGYRIQGGEPAYSWLPASLKGFPGRKEMTLILGAAGLQDITIRPLTRGVVTLYAGAK